MNDELLKRAEQYASRPYITVTFLDKTTDGRPTHVALVPELPGCHTHADTVPEALSLLDEVKAEFIYFLLEDGLPVPDPQPLGQGFSIEMSDYLGNPELGTNRKPKPRGELVQSAPGIVPPASDKALPLGAAS